MTTIQESSNRFDLKPLTRIELLTLMNRAGFLWDRDGMVRRVPIEVFGNAYAVMGMYRTMQQVDRIVEMPANAGVILWEQTLAIDEH